MKLLLACAAFIALAVCLPSVFRLIYEVIVIAISGASICFAGAFAYKYWNG